MLDSFRRGATFSFDNDLYDLRLMGLLDLVREHERKGTREVPGDEKRLRSRAGANVHHGFIQHTKQSQLGRSCVYHRTKDVVGGRPRHCQPARPIPSRHSTRLVLPSILTAKRRPLNHQ